MTSEEINKKNLQNLVQNMRVNAFIGVTFPILEDHPLAYLLNQEEEHMVDIDQCIENMKIACMNDTAEEYMRIELKNLRDMQDKGVTDIVLIKAD